MKTPILVMTGSADQFTPVELGAYPIYEHIKSPKKSLAVFEGGDHWFGWPRYRDAMIHIMTAFLQAELKGDAKAAQAFRPENLKLPGVRYETTTTD